MPSPHVLLQGPTALVAVPHSGSFWQFEAQPSYGRVLPSSQVSPASFTWLPQTVGLQVLGLPVQSKPGSILQLSEQPSPPAVLPSSQVSKPLTRASPHRVEHARPGTRQI